jgi:hypothetical protein
MSHLAPSKSFWRLLDTDEFSDAILTGRDGVEDPEEGLGLRIVYDGGGCDPAVTITGAGQSIELYGASEIHQSRLALDAADAFARKFGPSIPYDVWRARKKECGS